MTKEMTSKERVRAAFDHRPVDRAPMMVLLGCTWVTNQMGISFDDLYKMEDLGAEAIVKTYEQINSDSVTAGLGYWMGCLNAIGCPIERTDQPATSIEVKACITDPDTDVPALDQSQIRAKLESSDLIRKLMQQTRTIKKLVGDKKYVAGGLIGPFSAACMMVGTREFMVLLGKRSPHVKPIMEYATEFCAQMANLFCENGCDIIMLCDPCSSGDLISPKTYEQWVVPSLKGMTDKLENCDIFMLHICGKAGMRLPQIKALGIHGFSVDSPVDLKDALEQAGDTLTMLGNLNPNEALLLGSSDDVYKAAYANAEIAGLNGGFVMMPGCDLGPKTPLENILAMSKAAADYAASVR